MICPEIHDNRIVLHAFDHTNCMVCGKDITTEHIPGNIVCPECSIKTGMCEICGMIVEPLGDEV